MRATDGAAGADVRADETPEPDATATGTTVTGTQATGTTAAGTVSPRQRGSALRRLFSRLAADPDELQADELQAAISGASATPIATCGDREQVCLVGTLRTVTFRPRAGVPALEADLWDGTGSVTVIWLGRRQIPGIDPGRSIKLRGRITTLQGHRAIYNPIYELRGAAGD